MTVLEAIISWTLHVSLGITDIKYLPVKMKMDETLEMTGKLPEVFVFC